MVTENLEENPVLKASWVSKLFFWWLNGLFGKGFKRDLELNDLYHVVPKDSSKRLGDDLSEYWDEELRRAKERNASYTKKHPDGKKKEKYAPSLTKAIIKLSRTDCLLVGTLALIEECFTRVAQPMCLGFLIRYFSNAGEFSDIEGYLFASGIVVTAILYTFTHHPFFFSVCHIGMQVRVACCSLVYRKALRLSQMSLAETTIGQLVNLLSNDVNRFDQITVFLVYLVVGPAQTIIITVILWTYLGPSCLVGLLVLVLFVPFQGYMGRLFSRLRVRTAGKTDTRIRLMNEIVTGMQVIKYYTWEKPFSDLVKQARKDEIKVIRKTSLLRAINMSIFYTSSKIIIFLTLLTYVLLDNKITAEKVFVTLSLYNNVRLVMTYFFPSAIAQLNETLVSIRRLENFLLMQEKDEPSSASFDGNKSSIENIPADLQKSEEKVSIVVAENFSAKWNLSYEEHTLANINFRIGPEELVTIIGPVGSGKSSLLYAIMNELPGITGQIRATGSISYASQEPWVYSGSVRDNILFGKEYDPVWYDQVIEACALTRDLTLLPHGDHSLAGDRGTSLSGGQKARINLARAVYANADIYLLDDPLSAVDASVSRHLFDKCINGILKGKTRVLVTHQLQYLKNQDHIILINNGRLELSGSFNDLVQSEINFATLIQIPETPNDPSATPLVDRSQSKITGKGIVNPRTRTGSQSSVRSLSITHQQEILGLGESTLLGNIYSHDAVVASTEDVIIEQELELSTEASSKSVLKSHSSNSSRNNNIEFVEFIPKQAEERRASGTVQLSLYGKYFRAGAGCCLLFVLITSNIMTQVLYTGSDYYLNFWTSAEERGNDLSNATSADCRNKDDLLYGLKCDSNTQMIAYSTIVGALFILSLIRTILFFNVSMNSSVNLHQLMFQGIIRAPMQFFEDNPVGRILNRFSKDIGQIDDALPPCNFDAVGILLNVVGILILIACVNPILIAPAAVLTLVFVYLRRFYLRTARSVKRLEGVARSPVFSHLSTTLYGLSTIRAFKTQADFIAQFDDHQDLHSSSWYLFLASTRWFGVRLDWISTIFIAFVTFSFMFSRNEGAAVGLAVASAMTLSGMFQWGIRQSAEVENQMVAVERVMEYTKIEPEAALESPPDRRPPAIWPSKGVIVMNNVKLQYGNHVVLDGISCEIHTAEKIGIVGRTGAGKSSLITALFRLAEPTGAIIIDGIDTQSIGLHDLRSKISIIPQDPVLFTGTLRKNLDPFDEYTDADIWSVLEQVHLAEEVRQIPDGIYVEISEGGSNFSVGQRQLVCLGRAILRKNKILVLDEATANVDPATDALIQSTIRSRFIECTVLTIAHRLHTVMDSDRILVMDAGKIKEFDVPYKLLQDKNSALYALVQETGKATAESLRQISKLSADDKKR